MSILPPAPTGAFPIVYLRLRKRVMAHRGVTIRLGDVAQILVDPKHEAKFKQLPLHTPSEADGSVLLIDMLKVVAAIRSEFSSMQLEHFGDPHVFI